MAQSRDRPMTLQPAALYTLVDLTDSDLGDLQRECETGCIDTGYAPGSSVRPGLPARFVGQTLRSVIDFHLSLGDQDTYDPTNFIVADNRNWRRNGVLLVTLDDDEPEGDVDHFRIKAAESGLSVVNLQIGNTSWEEEKESYEFDPDDEDDGAVDGSIADIQESEDDLDGPPAPTQNHTLGYYVPIYIHSALSEDEVVAKLEPGPKGKPPENFACRVQAKLTPSSSSSNSTQDLVLQAVSLHPSRYQKNKYLHLHYILVVDTDDPEENGMLMVLARANPQYIRIPFSCHDGLQTRFMTLANAHTDDNAEWPSDAVRSQPVFAVFQYNTHGKELGYGADLIDPDASKQKPGEERVVYAPQIVPRRGHGLERISWDYDEAVRRFPWFCREKRFVEGLDRTFFVCVDEDDVKETGLLLVRRSWDGNVWNRTRDELLDLPVEGVKSVRVPIKDALQILEKGRKGETDGMKEELKSFFT